MFRYFRIESRNNKCCFKENYPDGFMLAEVVDLYKKGFENYPSSSQSSSQK